MATITSDSAPIVIVGGGHAGVQMVDSLRSQGYSGQLTLFGDEACLPYQRPPLSKDFMVASADGSVPEALPLRASQFFEDCQVDFRAGCRVTGIDPGSKQVTTEFGETVEYSSLILATGARNRALSVPGSDLAGIHYLRTLAEAEALYGALSDAQRVVVIGAGFIGLEFAASARKRGLDVTVLEFAPRAMERAVSQAMSAFIAKVHGDSGIDLRFTEGIAAFTECDGTAISAVSTAGNEYAADLFVVGVGVVPCSELAEAAGLAVNDGIVVGGELRTSSPDIYALGDVARFPRCATGSTTRIESVQNATDQARHLAKVLTNREGAELPYRDVPWFWSHQGSTKLQIAGLATKPDLDVVRGDLASGKFSVFRYGAGVLESVESVNHPADHMAARRLLGQGRSLSPKQAADTDFNLKLYSQPS